MNESTSPEAAGNPGSTNRACENCSRAKAKCTPLVGGSDGRCARCSRLKKECTAAPRRQRKRRSPNHATNVAHLEEKLESLVSLLGARASVLNPELLKSLTRETSNEIDIITRDSSVEHQHDDSASALNAHETPSGNEPWKAQTIPHRYLCSSMTADLAHANSATSSSLISVGFAPSKPVEQTILPGVQAEGILNTFRERFAPQFPFIIIPADVDSRTLHTTRPWVYRAVILVANERHRAVQVETSKRIALDILEAQTLRGERSLDMLQGLLLHNAWIYYYSAVTPQYQSTAIFQIAQALVFDLALNKPVRDIDTSDMLPNAYKQPLGYTVRETKRTLDERRTYLACYFSSSVFSLHVRKSEVMHHTPYLDNCCKVLQEAQEYPSDAVLAALIRLQCIAESFQRNLVHTYEGPVEETKAPSWMYIQGMRSELQQFWMSISPELRTDSILLMTYHSAEAFLAEPGTQLGSVPLGLGGGNAQRLDTLYSCLMASQALLNHIISQPLSSYHSFSVIQLAFSGVGLSTLFKLSIVEEPGWNLVDVRKTVNVSEYFERLIERFEQAGANMDSYQTEPTARQCFPTGCAKAMRRILAFYETRLAAVPGTNFAQEPQMATGMEGIMYGEQFDWIDEAYWQEILGDVNFMPQ